MDALEKQVIIAESARPIGPYSVGVRAGHFIFVSGQIGIQSQTGELVPGGIEAETRQALLNLKSVLQAAGSGLELVVKTTVFLREMDDFARMNAVYAEFFADGPPARSTVQVAGLPRGAAVEIEAMAIVAPPRGD